MKFLKFNILFLLLLSSTLVMAQELPEGVDDINNSAEMKIHREKQRLNNLFFDALKARITDSPDKALTLFSDYVKEDPGNDAAWFELSSIYFNRNDIVRSIECGEKAYRIAPANTYYSIALAQLYISNSQYNEAKEIYESLYKINPGNQEYALELANTLLLLDKPSDAIKIFDDLESVTGINEEFSMQKHKIYLALGKDKKALTELENLSAAFPTDTRLLALLAEFYILQGDEEKGLLTYRKIEEIEPENPYINISLADLYRKKNDFRSATAYLKKGFSNPYLDANTKVQIMMTYYSQTGEYEGMGEDIQELSGILAEVHPNEPRVLSLRGEMLMMDEKWEEALTTFRKVNELDPGKYQVWENILRLNAIIGNTEMLMSESSQAMDLFPVQPMPYYFNGYAGFLLKDYDKALKSLTTGVKFVLNDNQLASDFYSMAGDAYHALEKHPESFNAYESALKYNSENPAVLNNYAYYLSLLGQDLQKALTMAEKANGLSPDNPTYLDTWAWVLYRKGDYKEALEKIEKALALDNKPGGVEMEHYGDILFKLNRTKEAIEWWRKAKDTGEGSDKLELKIKDGKLYE